MKVDFVAADAKPDEGAAVAVFAFEDGAFSPGAEALDGAMGGAIRKAIGSSRFKGAMGQNLTLLAPLGTPAARVAVIGAGKQDAFEGRQVELAAASAYNAVRDSGCQTLLIA